MPITVVVADDHQIVRECLRALLERDGFGVVGEAANGEQALQIVQTLCPDVAVLDVQMPILNGVDTAREIKRLAPKTKPILLTMYADNEYIMEGLQGGAKGYVMKMNAAEDLARAVREAAHGGVYLSPEIRKVIEKVHQNHYEVLRDPLSQRERQVLQLIADGKITKEVATALGISVKTVETHRSRIMLKLDLHMVADLVRYAVRRGIVQA